jgi:3-hydroxyisobutyrate dehydrogenase-like beta-hydroxyacid dehydrogenase
MAQGVGFIGLGTMGFPFATNIAQAGFDLMVYDVRPEPLDELRKLGAKVGSTPKQVAEHAAIVHIAVPHEPEVEAVLGGEDGLLEGMKPGAVLAIHSSLHPNNMKRIASEVEARGITVLDAQMSGGARGVTSHTLCFMVGGEASALERCRPTLETTGKDIFLMGPVGAGALTKIAQNTITAMHLAVATEGYGFAKAAGIDLEMFQEVIRASAAQSHVADSWLTQWAPRNARWQYHEVLENALQIGRQIDAPLPTAALCQQLLATILRKPD